MEKRRYLPWGSLPPKLKKFLTEREVTEEKYNEANGDIHKLHAAYVLQKPIGEITAEERATAKRSLYGYMYGGQGETSDANY